MSRIGPIAITVMAFVALSGITASGGTAASTQRADSSCPAETLCVWSGKNYQGQRVKLTKMGEVSNKLAHEMNNQASSYKNKFTSDVGELYDKKDGEGDFWGICPDENEPNLVGFNNRASSSSIGFLRPAQRVC